MANSQPIVWVIKEQFKQGAGGPEPIDYTPAMQYGDVHFITEFDVPTGPSKAVRESWFEGVAKFCDDYDPKRDFVVLTGSPTALFLVGAMMADKGALPLRLLIWRREENRYIPFETDL